VARSPCRPHAQIQRDCFAQLEKGSTRQVIAPIHQKPIKPPPLAHPFLIKEIALQAGLSEAQKA
jgi:hypothetical protein